MAGLSTFQSGPKGPKVVQRDPKGSKMVNQDVFEDLGPFLGPSGPFWTISIYSNVFCSKAPPPNPTLSLWGNKRVPNCQIHLSLPFRTLLDPFGPLWHVLLVFFLGHTTVSCFGCAYIDFTFLCCTFKSSTQTSNVMRQFVDNIFLFFFLWSVVW